MKKFKVKYSSCYYDIDHYQTSDDEYTSGTEEEILDRLYKNFIYRWRKFERWPIVDEVWGKSIDDDDRITLVEIFDHEPYGANYFNNILEKYSTKISKDEEEKEKRDIQNKKDLKIQEAKKLLEENGII